MAEGWARHLAEDGTEIKSAGVFVSGVHPLAVEVMKQAGIDISHHQAQPVSNDLMNWADIIITLCDTVKPFEALFPNTVIHHHWSINNPDDMVSDEMSQKQAYALVRDDIRDRTEALLESL